MQNPFISDADQMRSYLTTLGWTKGIHGNRAYFKGEFQINIKEENSTWALFQQGLHLYSKIPIRAALNNPWYSFLKNPEIQPW